MLNMFLFDVFSVCYPLGQSVMGMNLFIFGLCLGNIGVHRKFYKIQNMCMVNIFSFDVFSVCLQLDQSVTGIALLIFWLKPQKAFHVKFTICRIFVLSLTIQLFFFTFCGKCRLCKKCVKMKTFLLFFPFFCL